MRALAHAQSHCCTTSAPLANQVRTNHGGKATLNGDIIHIIYTPDHFSTFPHFAPNGTAVNGGIPQRGNLSLHLALVQREVKAMFPNASYDGCVCTMST